MIKEATLKKIKLTSIVIIGVALSFFTSHFIYRAFITLDLWMFIGGAITALLFFVVLSLETLFLPRTAQLVPLVVLQTLPIAAAFVSYLYPDLSTIILVGLVVFVFFAAWGVKRGATAVRNSLSIKAAQVAHIAVPKIAVGLLVFGVLAAYTHFFSFGNLSEEVGKEIFDKTLNASVPAVNVWMPGLSFDMGVYGAIRQVSEIQLKRSKFELLKQGVNFDELPPSAQKELLDKTSEEVGLALENLLGHEIQADQPLRDALYLTLTEQLSKLPKTVAIIAQVIAALALFYVLRFIMWILYIPVELLTFVLFKILLLLGFVEIATEQTQREVVVF